MVFGKYGFADDFELRRFRLRCVFINQDLTVECNCDALAASLRDMNSVNGQRKERNRAVLQLVWVVESESVAFLTFEIAERTAINADQLHHFL